MPTTRAVGLTLAAVATASWVVILVAFLATGPDEGVNIGAAVLALLAVPMSIGASVTLLAARASAPAAAPRPAAGRVAAALAVTSIVCLAAPAVSGPFIESEEAAAVAGVVLSAGVVTFAASSALFALPRRRR